MKNPYDENWEEMLLPKGNIEINLSTGEERLMPKISKTYTCELKDFSDSERAFTATASTDSVDREGDILRADGWKLKNFKKNPSFLWGHDDRSLPIGKALDTRVEGTKLIFRPKFATAEENPFADQVFRMFKAGNLRAFSVRFDPISSKPRELTDKEKERFGSFFRMPREFTSMELLEISAVNIPANAEALKSVDMQDFMVKSYIAESMRLFPGVDFGRTDFKTKTTTGNIEFDFKEDLKDKYSKIDDLKKAKEKKVVEKQLDTEIEAMEKELLEDTENEKAIDEIGERMKNLQAGITDLSKK